MRNIKRNCQWQFRFSLFAVIAFVARAHALIARLAAMAIGGGLYLNTGQGAIVLTVTMEITALHTTADVGIRLLLTHFKSPRLRIYRFRQSLECAGSIAFMRP